MKILFGWIKVNNTNINYPVVQSTNNHYYLKHGFDKAYRSSGSIFVDYQNNLESFDQNTIIYGHNRRDGSMFSTLNLALEDSWYKQLENQWIHFNTLTKTTIWQIFSIYQENTKKISNPISFSSNIDFINFINNVKNRSLYDFNVSFNKHDKILTLYTCGNHTSYRIIVHAKLVYEKQHK